jgi:hypothetical protein
MKKILFSILPVLLFVAFISSCGTRNVIAERSVIDAKETSIVEEKTEVLEQQESKQETYVEQKQEVIDTGKVVEENITVVEIFNPEGQLTKRITSHHKNSNNKAKRMTKTVEQNLKRIDTSDFRLKGTLKDSTISTIKQVVKNKETSSTKTSIMMFVLFFLCVGIFYLYNKR